ncbi:hypothetical protein [Chryseobacterium sp. SG20098]|uniref:hypothetical protein n=1 Tax=Chryseobacterium sp. SG20098 TaxID=3074145 RepID=UPI002883407F|nr:hypothetical protein [Chryseobacterium sp. SG20098]WNI35422.1 hypothetical protein RHP76_15745 [Chryseobacterium sp. SG20098]
MERISIYCIILSVFSISILHAQAVVLAAGLDASAAITQNGENIKTFKIIKK